MRPTIGQMARWDWLATIAAETYSKHAADAALPLLSGSGDGQCACMHRIESQSPLSAHNLQIRICAPCNKYSFCADASCGREGAAGSRHARGVVVGR